ncbi:hypothetical protein VSDG_08845 [Cytospora chrysosperma]|uniref:Uncharacterized protein n=1 Tax=Cytospora chrysosperma TaxID=252740 RepID=A0A423VDU8_CYTCH|nr:hypothetical protein VSDG_08845 [Valsa sordida]
MNICLPNPRPTPVEETVLESTLIPLLVADELDAAKVVLALAQEHDLAIDEEVRIVLDLPRPGGRELQLIQPHAYVFAGLLSR